MSGNQLRQKIVGDSWMRIAIVLALGLVGGGTGSSMLAQPRTDTEIRDIAAREVEAERRVTDERFKAIIEKVDGNTSAIKDLEGTVEHGVEEILRRLPR